MSQKRNPKSKRVQDADTGKFISEDEVNSLTPFGYNEGASTWRKVLLYAVGAVLTLAVANAVLPL